MFFPNGEISMLNIPQIFFGLKKNVMFALDL